MTQAASFRFNNSFAREIEGCYVPWRPSPVPAPRLLFLNRSLAPELGLDTTALDDGAWAATFAGNDLPDGAEPIAQAYAGHQFGGFSPQLGDGRALLVGEVIDREGRRRDIAFKGSGRTPLPVRADPALQICYGVQLIDRDGSCLVGRAGIMRWKSALHPVSDGLLP